MIPMSSGSAPIGATLEMSMNIKGIFHTLEANQAVLAVAGQVSYIFKEHPVDWRQVGLCRTYPGYALQPRVQADVNALLLPEHESQGDHPHPTDPVMLCSL